MQILEKHIKIFTAEICPYCGSKTRRTTETDIYGKEYSGRDIITCLNYPKCNSYVGCHKDGRPLGRLANKELREAKINAHDKFDALWKSTICDRSEAYKMLSDYLGIPPEYTHIGMFSIKTLKKVEAWSVEKFKELCSS